MPELKWSLRGEYMESCNCDYLCPCIFTNPQGPVTYDHCTAVLVFRIDDSVERGARLSALIHDAVESDRRRHVDDEAEPE